MVAGIATIAVVLAQQARAESGEAWAAAREASIGIQTASAEASAPVVERVEGEQPIKLLSRRSASLVQDAARAASMRGLIVRVASENAVPFQLADAVVRIESRYNAGARNGPHMGLTQINVRTAQSLGYQGSAGGLLDAETNLRYGLKYLAQAYKLAGGDTCGTILRYQAGHRALTMTSQARAYCARVKTIIAEAE